jgi:6-phosphogluconolactonase
VSGGTPPPQSLLLAGWIISSLDLDLESATGRTVSLTAPDGHPITLQFPEENGGDSERVTVRMTFGRTNPSLEFRLEGESVAVTFDGATETFTPGRPFDRAAFVVEQSGKDRVNSSYAASYRVAQALYGRWQGTAGRRAMIVVPEPAKLARVAARLFYRLALPELEAKKSFFVALAGGVTPRMVYRAIVESPYSGAVDWDSVFFFFSDERGVGPDNSMSNFGTANEFLFQPLRINSDNVFRLEGERRPLREACRRYEEIIAARVPRDESGIPRFDLIFLGMGEDGHTASLFPETDIDRVCGEHLVVHIYLPRLDQQRLSFTPKLINAAAQVFFVVSGENKAAALEKVFTAAPPRTLPAARIDPTGGGVLWLVDEAAAGRLTGMTLPVEITRW